MELTNFSEVATALNDLIIINKDRIAGYEKAEKLTKNEELKTLFQRLAEDSTKNIHELSDQLIKINNKPVDSSSLPGKFYRSWMNVKALFSGNDDHSILSDCEFGETIALENYKKVEQNILFTMGTTINMLIEQQKSRITDGHDLVKRLRNALRTP
ncbi:ferritin-like domain-containing protein [Solitalea canadensis]|uniref:DUF2383 domain-containing protein n=1 Tax=Solitalea canadensis (strain ATCC 29591 / DSM 3403 / JCM 21819 / LMG 8368 / NBRC 15130 / NCIMB 12057 / USAM 9D) TaxID=929556 RepID=H8KTN2_SOLCM|nr:PA2169 family four-helix-bundle protein [Solitalea canadensis]AFD06607.1 hypothetical protein Solca_1534 [Solitalea canadensis DSM 3403]